MKIYQVFYDTDLVLTTDSELKALRMLKDLAYKATDSDLRVPFWIDEVEVK